MKKIILTFTALFLLGFLVISLVSSEDQTTSTSDNKAYSQCLRQCMDVKKTDLKNCIANSSSASKTCSENLKTCLKTANEELKNKAINKTTYREKKITCIKNHTECMTTKNKERVDCLKKVIDSFQKCNDDCKKNMSCPVVNTPVCGVDNKTYSNNCELKKAGVEKACSGQCPCKTHEETPGIKDSCTKNEDCSKDKYCKFEKCGDANGKCTRAPQVCLMNYMPVCGCDNKTYPNECVMMALRASEKSKGECAASP